MKQTRYDRETKIVTEEYYRLTQKEYDAHFNSFNSFMTEADII